MSATMIYSEERLMKVLLAPVISEKSTFVAEKNEQVVFRVMPDATKLEIKAAVELLFKGKQKRTAKGSGRRNHVRNAYVCLKPGQEINFTEEAK